MELKQLVQMQRDFDERHGWNPDKTVPTAVFRAVQDDVIGMLGELGEFANIVKKITLEAKTSTDSDLAGTIGARHDRLSEELVDAFIYLVRLASHLGIDLEHAYLKKLRTNEERFKDAERR